MTRPTFVNACLALCAVLLMPAMSLAQAAQAPPPAPAQLALSCTRGGLQRAVNLYVEAQKKGDLSGLPLARGVGYWENIAPADITKGIVNKAMKIDHHRSFLDTDSCQTFTEVIVTDKAAPYVLGTRLRVNHDKIAEVEVIWTTTGYWLFILYFIITDFFQSGGMYKVNTQLWLRGGFWLPFMFILFVLLLLNFI